MVHYLRALDVEFFKLRRSFVWFIVILAPLVMIINGTANFVRFQDILVKEDGVAWLKLYVQIDLWYGILLLPLSIGVLSMLLSRTEHAENAWKYVLALPISRNMLYAAKVTTLIILTGVSLLLLSLGIYVSGLVLGISESIPYAIIFGNSVLGLVACLPIIAIQLLLSMRFPSIGISMGFSAATAVAGIIITNSKYAVFYIWSYPALTMLPNGQGFHILPASQTIFVSSIIFCLVTFIGMWEFNRRDIQ